MRCFLRNVLVCFAIVLTIPFWGLVLVNPFGNNLFITWGMLLSLFPGTLGVYLRRGYYVMTLQSYSWDSSIGFGSWFSKQNTTIGSRVSIGAGCIIGMCEIGDGTLIGCNIDILSGRHQHGTVMTMEGEKDSQALFSSIQIGSNVWIGNHSVVMADVGENSIVGAGSVVVKHVPSNVIAMGNPAVVKKC